MWQEQVLHAARVRPTMQNLTFPPNEGPHPRLRHTAVGVWAT